MNAHAVTTSLAPDCPPLPSLAPSRVIPFGRPCLGEAERQAVLRVLDGPTLTHGPRVAEFEAAFAAWSGAPHAVATSSCAAALQLAYLSLGVWPGDEVLVAAQTHVATAHAAELCGARCVFIDSESRSGNINPARIEAAITSRTRAVALVHYNGVPADVRRVAEICQRYGLALVEDCALSLGATVEGTHTGLFGDAGCFSFYPAKHITTAEGGMLITRRADVAHAAGRLRAFGVDRNIVSQRAIPGMYDVPGIGLNYRMNELSAALGIEQLKRLPEILRLRRRNYRLLHDALQDVEEVRVLGGCEDLEQRACYCLVLMLAESLCPRRVELIRRLNARGVGTSVYYPAPVPRLTYYREKYGTRGDEFPNAAWISDASIALPVGPHIEPDDVAYIAESVAAGVMELRG